MDHTLDRISRRAASRRGVLAAAAATLLPAAERTGAVTARTSRKRGRTALVRFLHAAPDAPAVDVYAEDRRLATGLAHSQVTDSTTCAPGDLRVVVVPEGGDPASPLLDFSIGLAASRSFIVAIAGGPSASGGRSSLDVQGLLFEQDTSRITDREISRATVIHLSPGVAAIHVGLAAADVDARGLIQPPLATDLRFGEQSGPVEFQSDAYNVVTWDPRGEWASGGVLQLDAPSFAGRETSAIVTLDAVDGVPLSGVKIDFPTRSRAR